MTAEAKTKKVQMKTWCQENGIKTDRPGFVKISLKPASWYPFSFYKGDVTDHDSAVELETILELCKCRGDYSIPNFLSFGLIWSGPIYVKDDTEAFGDCFLNLTSKRWQLDHGDVTPAKHRSSNKIRTGSGKYYEILRERLGLDKEEEEEPNLLDAWRKDLLRRFFDDNEDLGFSHSVNDLADISGRVTCYVDEPSFRDAWLECDAIVDFVFIEGDSGWKSIENHFR